jgi:3'-phosphoadenosine 5'-phosphosulfate sulfotransferase (PAPS reductase)/FAD synthetase
MSELVKAESVLHEAQGRFDPYAKVLMFSGGKDSMATWEVCKALGVKLDFVMHINTGIGIPETTEFVKSWGNDCGVPFIETSAGSTYDDYVIRKGFFGVGTGFNSAHSMAFRLLKRVALTAACSSIRQRKRNRPILLINGARTAESANRMENMAGKYIKCDRYTKGKPASSNWWVSPLLDWSDDDRDTFLQERRCPINPVSKAICRSGECMCGTTQGSIARAEASDYSPRFKERIDRIDEIGRRLHGWGWGEPMPKQLALEKKGQLRLFDDSPMCFSCRADAIDVPFVEAQ